MADDKGHHGDSKDQLPSLDEKVDWMTFTHQQLYDMLDKGVNLDSANQVKDGWAKLSTELDAVKKDLLQAVVDSSEGWRGESAQKARDGLISVVDWAENTSTHAAKVEACITSEIQHVVEAKNKMPVPAPAPPLVTPVVPPVAVQSPTAIAPATRSRILLDDIAVERFSAYDSPVGIDSLRAQPRVTSPWTEISQVGAPVVDATTSADATHRQAADVMAWFQQSSYAVDQTVPQFSPPTNPVAPLVPPTSGPGTGPSPLTAPADDSTVVSASATPEAADRQHTNAAAQQRGGGGFGSMRGDFSAGGFSPVIAGQVAGGGGGGGGSLSGPGSSAGVLNNASEAARSTAASAGAAAAAAGGGQSSTRNFNPGGMMGAPMAPGVAPASRGDERDYQRASYLEDDDNLFGVERKAAPPVIGQ